MSTAAGPAKILVVDDNDITRKLLRVTLSPEGYTVIEASDGATAMRVVRVEQPDLILQDLVLPDMGGIELVQRLRAEPAAADIPILAFSGFQSEMELADELHVGFTDFLFKPVEPNRLIEVVRTYLPTDRAARPRGGRLVLVDDDPLQLKLMAIRLQQHGYEVVTAHSGPEALDLIRRSPPDAVVADVLMPEMDGFTLCLSVQRDPDLAGIPVLLISSAYTEPGDRALARQVGATALILRAADSEEVFDVLSRELARPHAATREVASIPTEQYLQRIVRQLDRQAEQNFANVRRLSVLETELSLLTGLSDLLAASAPLEEVATELLERCLSGSGLSSGFIFLLDSDQPLLIASRGIREDLRLDREAYLALTDGITPSDPPRLIQREDAALESVHHLFSGLNAKSIVVSPIHVQNRLAGALVLVSDRAELGEGWIPFARAIGNHVSSAVAQARAWRRIEESEQLYRAVVDGLSEGIAIVRGGVRLLANHSFLDILGLKDAPDDGTPFLDFVVPEDREIVNLMLDARRSSHATRTPEVRLRRPDGDSRIVQIDAHPITFGGETSLLIVLRDLTETAELYESMRQAVASREQVEEQLRHAQKMEAVGNLAGGVAHDFNNLLTAIIGFGEMALSADEPIESLHDYVREMLQAGERAATLTRQLLAFSRRQVLRPEVVNLNQVVSQISRLLQRVIGEDVELQSVLHEDLGYVRADPGQIEQVILNLAVNARDAMPQGGRITIETRNVTLDASYADSHFETVPGPYVALYLSDSGTGISPDVLPRIFEPFFTTKEQGRGTGLGLSTVYGIVKQSGGHISVYSEVGVGTTFRVYFPLVDAPPLDSDGQEPDEPGEPRPATILLVEDEVSVRTLARAVLSSAGYTVLDAASPAEALEVIASMNQPADLLVTDVIMPGMNGPDLAHRVRGQWPEIKVVFTSGYPGDHLKRQGTLDASSFYVEKPFTPKTLRSTIHEALQARDELRSGV
jgi:PAS domain S-box-containing protein